MRLKFETKSLAAIINPNDAFFILSGQGNILFFKDSSLRTNKIDAVISLLQQQLNERQGKKLATTQ